jgi:hypothetical protein
MNNKCENELLFDAESIEQLGPEKKSDYIRLAIINCLSTHPEGITVQLLCELTGLTQKTIKKHLDQLTATREAYKKEYGTRISIYFPNGKQNNQNATKIITVGNSLFQFQIIENTWGKYIYIQERKRDSYSNMIKTIGGIMIDYESASEFINVMKEITAGTGDLDNIIER